MGSQSTDHEYSDWEQRITANGREYMRQAHPSFYDPSTSTSALHSSLQSGRVQQGEGSTRPNAQHSTAQPSQLRSRHRATTDAGDHTQFHPARLPDSNSGVFYPTFSPRASDVPDQASSREGDEQRKQGNGKILREGGGEGSKRKVLFTMFCTTLLAVGFMFVWFRVSQDRESAAVMVDALQMPYWDNLKDNVSELKKTFENGTLSNVNATYLTSLSRVEFEINETRRLDRSISITLGGDVLTDIKRLIKSPQQGAYRRLDSTLALVHSQSSRATNQVRGFCESINDLHDLIESSRAITASQLSVITSRASRMVFSSILPDELHKQRTRNAQLKTEHLVWQSIQTCCAVIRSALHQELQRREKIHQSLEKLLNLTHNFSPTTTNIEADFGSASGNKHSTRHATLRSVYIELYEKASADDQSLETLRQHLPLH